MDRRIKNYVDTLFIDVPKTKKSNKIKNDLIKSMMDRSKDYLKDGCTTSQAYRMTIASFADVDDLIEEAQIPDDNIVQTYENIYPDNYKRRTRQLSIISISLFILSPVILVLTAFIDLFLVGFFVVPFIAIISCSLSIYIGSLKSHTEDNEFSQFIEGTKKSNKIAIVFTSIVVTALYVVIGLFTEIWHPTWIIFFIVPIAREIFHTLTEITQLRGGNDNDTQ